MLLRTMLLANVNISLISIFQIVLPVLGIELLRVDSLTNINIPNSVTNIKEWTFAHCKSLTNVNIPNCVTTIGEAAFCRCTSLTSINIPNNVTTVEEGVFCGCIYNHRTTKTNQKYPSVNL